jgi:predicted DNA-binding transcriptional regulator AlpA
MRSLDGAGSPTAGPRPATPITDAAFAMERDQRLVLGAAKLAVVLDVSVRTIRRMETAGLLPRSVRINGSRKWVYAEIEDWIKAGCPAREQWEAMQNRASGRIQAARTRCRSPRSERK